jgi:hypothetical protein
MLPTPLLEMHRRFRSVLHLLAAGVAILVAPTGAHADELFVDDFSVLDSTFGDASDTVFVEDGAIVRKMEPNYWYRFFYEGMTYDDCDIKVKVQIPSMTQGKGTGVGIMFWGMEPTNCYVYQLNDYGELCVRQYRTDRTLMPVYYQKNEAIKTEPGAWNELRVRLVGNFATFFINGKEITTIKGHPPEGISLVGLFSETGSVADVAKHSDLKIVDPVDAPEAIAVPIDESVLLADDFATFNPSFGASTEKFFVENNELVMQLDPSQWWRYNYESDTFGDVDASLKVKLPDMTAEEGTSIGLMFWTNSINDMYVFQLSDSQTFSVLRYTGGKYLYPVVWQNSDAIKTDPDEWNDLRVVTHGKHAILYINGQEVAKIKGHPAEAGNMVGVFCWTGANAGVEARFSDLKVKPAPASSGPVEQDVPGVLLSDDFSEFDSGWGAESGTFGVKEGKMFVTLEPGKGLTKLYDADIFTGDTDGTVKGVCNDNNNESIADLGYIFWANGYDDFWSLDVYDNGGVGVSHFVNGKWLSPMRTKAIPPEANFDPNGVTTLRVVTEGRKALLYVNGVQVGTVSGMPPKEGTYLGVYVGAGTAPFTGYVDEIVVKQKE